MHPPDRLRATYLFSRACSSHDEGLALLHAAARDAGVALDVEVVEVTGDDQAAALGFPGSPTYLLEGADPFPPEGPPHAPAADACRAYARPAGRIGPLPHRDDLASALREAAARRSRA